jgi:hypothetical protein
LAFSSMLKVFADEFVGIAVQEIGMTGGFQGAAEDVARVAAQFFAPCKGVRREPDNTVGELFRKALASGWLQPAMLKRNRTLGGPCHECVMQLSRDFGAVSGLWSNSALPYRHPAKQLPHFAACSLSKLTIE